jgi:mannosyltransferase
MPSFRSRQAGPGNPLRQLTVFALRHWKILSLVFVAVLLELLFHIRSFNVDRPATDLDPPFYVGCQERTSDKFARANATLTMLARNSDVDGAVASVKSVQKQFNDHYDYPWVFLNNEPWSNEFITKVTAAGAGARMVFSNISKAMWRYPEWIDEGKARRNMHGM